MASRIYRALEPIPMRYVHLIERVFNAVELEIVEKDSNEYLFTIKVEEIPSQLIELLRDWITKYELKPYWSIPGISLVSNTNKVETVYTNIRPYNVNDIKVTLIARKED
jgi:protein tyrosine phosphatase